MSTIVHLSVSVRGLLHRNDRELKQDLKWITKEGGKRYRSVAELREALMDELAAGHLVLPTTPECEGFDYKTGCPGHEEGSIAHGQPTAAV